MERFWLRSTGIGCSQRIVGRSATLFVPKRGLGHFACIRTQASPLHRKQPESFRSRPTSALSSSTAPVGLLNHLSRHASSDSSSATDAKVICSTKEHSPGNNVATISISNPAKLNIVSSPVLQELIKTCREISKDDQLRAVVLTGAPTAPGKAASFIGGADIKEMSQMSSYEQAEEFITLVHNACQALRDVPVPIIGRVSGFALGAGLEILATCDLRIATKDSTLGMPEVKIGLPSVVEAAYLPGLMGWGRYVSSQLTPDGLCENS